MASVITDPRLLLQMIDAEIPVVMGSTRLVGTITDYENTEWATVQVTLYLGGPQLSQFQVAGLFSWAAVLAAYYQRGPLKWY